MLPKLERNNILLRSNLEKCGNVWKKRPFFRVDIAGLGEIHHGHIWPDRGP